MRDEFIPLDAKAFSLSSRLGSLILVLLAIAVIVFETVSVVSA
jgi:hypothetical protein